MVSLTPAHFKFDVRHRMPRRESALGRGLLAVPKPTILDRCSDPELRTAVRRNDACAPFVAVLHDGDFGYCGVGVLFAVPHLERSFVVRKVSFCETGFGTPWITAVSNPICVAFAQFPAAISLRSIHKFRPLYPYGHLNGNYYTR